MDWFPLAFSTAIGALILIGVQNPSRAFSVLPYLATIDFIWIVKGTWEELKRPAGPRSRPSH